MSNIAILDDYQNVALDMADWSELQSVHKLSVFTDHISDEQQLIARLQNFDIVCVMRERTPLTKNVFQNLPELKLVITTGMRNASIDLESASNQGVIVCGTDGLAYPTAELTWGLVLDLARNISHEDKTSRLGKWQTRIGTGLNGKTLGIIGLGRLGSQVANYGNAFGMNVLAWSQNLTKEKAEKEKAQLATFKELLTQSDFISIHTVLSDRTRGLIGTNEFKLMKGSAFLINTSRGPIVNEEDLLAALKSRNIAGAGIDVFSDEPLDLNHELMQLNNVVITPHIGYVTKETYKIFYSDTVDCIKRYFDGKPIRVLSR